MPGLEQLPPGQIARVLAVHGPRAFRRRLMEIGLVPGTPVERVGGAGVGGPLRFRVRDAVVALRRVDAARVEVDA